MHVLARRMNDRADVSYGQVSLRYEDSKIAMPLTVNANPPYLPLIWHWGAPDHYQQGTIPSRIFFDALGGFGESYRLAAVHAFWLRAWKQGAVFRYCDEPRAYFRLCPAQPYADLQQMRNEIGRATIENFPLTGLFERFFRFTYWRLLGMRSLMAWIRCRLPCRIKAGT